MYAFPWDYAQTVCFKELRCLSLRVGLQAFPSKTPYGSRQPCRSRKFKGVHTNPACERCEATNRKTPPSRPQAETPTTRDRPRSVRNTVRARFGSYSGPDERTRAGLRRRCGQARPMCGSTGSMLRKKQAEHSLRIACAMSRAIWSRGRIHNPYRATITLPAQVFGRHRKQLAPHLRPCARAPIQWPTCREKFATRGSEA